MPCFTGTLCFALARPPKALGIVYSHDFLVREDWSFQDATTALRGKIHRCVLPQVPVAVEGPLTVCGALCRNHPVRALVLKDTGVHGLDVLLEKSGRWMLRVFQPQSHFIAWLAEERILFVNPEVHVLDATDTTTREAAEVRAAWGFLLGSRCGRCGVALRAVFGQTMVLFIDSTGECCKRWCA